MPKTAAEKRATPIIKQLVLTHPQPCELRTLFTEEGKETPPATFQRALRAARGLLAQHNCDISYVRTNEGPRYKLVPVRGIEGRDGRPLPMLGAVQRFLNHGGAQYFFEAQSDRHHKFKSQIDEMINIDRNSQNFILVKQEAIEISRWLCQEAHLLNQLFEISDAEMIRTDSDIGISVVVLRLDDQKDSEIYGSEETGACNEATDDELIINDQAYCVTDSELHSEVPSLLALGETAVDLENGSDPEEQEPTIVVVDVSADNELAQDSDLARAGEEEYDRITKEYKIIFGNGQAPLFSEIHKIDADLDSLDCTDDLVEGHSSTEAERD